jgi:hypothetical protein
MDNLRRLENEILRRIFRSLREEVKETGEDCMMRSLVILNDCVIRVV